MGRLISIGQASKLAGVSVETLREWERVGKISSHRTQGGHRRYDINQFIEPMPRQTIVLEIITVFSARLYGSRSRKNLKIMQKLHEIPQEISQD